MYSRHLSRVTLDTIKFILYKGVDDMFVIMQSLDNLDAKGKDQL